MDKKEKEEFMKQKRAAYKKARTFGLFLFIVVMAFCCILGLMIPVRPKESVLEKRELAKFPKILFQVCQMEVTFLIFPHGTLIPIHFVMCGCQEAML